MSEYGGVALYAPPAKVRPLKGSIDWSQTGITWQTNGSVFTKRRSGLIPLQAVQAVFPDSDGSVVVVHVEAGREVQLAFWPGDRRPASAARIATAIEQLRNATSGKHEGESSDGGVRSTSTPNLQEPTSHSHARDIEAYDESSQDPGRFERLMPKYSHHPVVERVGGLTNSQPARDKALSLLPRSVDDVIQSQVQQFLSTLDSRFGPFDTPRRTAIGTAIYTACFEGWFTGYCVAEADGWSPGAADLSFQRLADATYRLFQETDFSALPELDWYVLDNFAGLHVSLLVSDALQLSLDQVVERNPMAQEIVTLGNVSLYWGYSLFQAQRQLTEDGDV